MNLAPNVFLATLDGRSVVLDLNRDRYVGLGKDLSRAALQLTGDLAGLDAGESDMALEASRAKLVAQGILTHSPPPKPRRIAPVARASHWPSDRTDLAPPPPVDWRSSLSALRALGDAQTALRTRPFHRTIAFVDRVKARAGRIQAKRSEQALIDAFAAARPWFPVKPICRLDAIALCLYLNRNGHAADLIFGVRLDPFHAHCWVQRGEAVLNEAHDGVLKYTPIMVV